MCQRDYPPNSWTVGCTRLPTVSTQSLAVIRPFTVITGPAEYQDIAIQSSQIHVRVSQLKPDTQDYRLP